MLEMNFQHMRFFCAPEGRIFEAQLFSFLGKKRKGGAGEGI